MLILTVLATTFWGSTKAAHETGSFQIIYSPKQPWSNIPKRSKTTQSLTDCVGFARSFGDGSTPFTFSEGKCEVISLDGTARRFIDDTWPRSSSVELHVPLEFVKKGKKIRLQNVKCDYRAK